MDKDDVPTTSNYRNHKSVCRNGRWGFANENGHLVIACRYDEVGSFNWLGYVAPVRLGDAWTFITRKGKLASSYTYEVVVDYFWRSYLVQRDGLWGFVNDYGQEVIPCQYEAVRPVDDESRLVFNMVETPVCRFGKWGLINDKGQEVLPCQFDDIRNFSDTQAEVRIGKRWEAISFVPLP